MTDQPKPELLDAGAVRFTMHAALSSATRAAAEAESRVQNNRPGAEPHLRASESFCALVNACHQVLDDLRWRDGG